MDVVDKIVNKLSFSNFRRPENYSLLQDGSDGMDNIDNPLQMQNRTHIRQEQTMEAEVLEKDSLQAISLRFNCSVIYDFFISIRLQLYNLLILILDC